MSGLFGVLRTGGAADPLELRRMGAALRRHPGQQLQCAGAGPVDVGVLRRNDVLDRAWRITNHNATATLWFAGDVFSTRHPLPVHESPDAAVWQPMLLDAFFSYGVDAIAGLNGDFQLAIWDAQRERLSIAVDRFATTPLYWTNTSRGFWFASGVRALLVNTPFEARPDIDALREAVTFGGYRLGARTNIAGVHMLRPGEVVHVTRSLAVTSSSYWSWQQLPASPVTDLDEAVDAVHAGWQRAVRRRLHGVRRPGQTLSGGRDSRAVLAEAAPQAPCWKAITYGVNGCDDARYAGQAAAAANVSWDFVPLYGRTSPDWLERRTSEVQHTDGLIDLVDLMHLENVPLLIEGIDCHLPGYLGDVIVGTTYDHVKSLDEATIALAFTGAAIALPWSDAQARLVTSSMTRAECRSLIFEHKFPQAIGRPNAALASWTDVRRPFLDLDLVETAMAFPADIRARLYDHWVRREYPTLFATIPLQKTGLPVGSSTLRRNIARAGRKLRRQARTVAQALGRDVSPWSRTYTADEAEFARPGVRDRIEATILRPESIACGIWGRHQVQQLVENWMTGAGGSAQVIGALYTWESYHEHLPAFLRDCTREVGR